MLVGKRLQARLLELVDGGLRHLGVLGHKLFVDGLHRIHRVGAGDLSVVQHALVGIGQVLLGEVRVIGHVHHDVGKRRRQVFLAGGVALARKVHRRCQHLGEQVEAHRAHVAALLGAQQAARAADLQVAHGNAHAAAQLGVLAERGKARHRFLGKGDVVGEQEVGVGLRARAPHAALQLVHLRQAQPLRVLDDERVGVRVVDAALDDGGGHQHIQLAGSEVLHHLFQLLFRHLAVRHAHARLARSGLHAAHRLVDGAHAVAHVVHLPIALQLAADGIAHHIGVPLAHVHLHRPAVVGRREDQAHVAHTGKPHLHGARDGRCRKREHVDGLAHVLQLFLVRHAEALLLVDDHQAQVVRVHIAREQAMRAHQNGYAAVGKARQRLLLLRGRAEAREHLHLHVEGLEALLERGVVLLRQDGGGAQHHDLLVVLRRLERRAQRHLGLAEAHVAAHQAVHRARRLHVGLDVGDGGQLVGRFLVGEAFLHLALPRRVLVVAVALGGGAARVHVHQVERQLLRCLARLGHGTAPVGGVKAREPGRCAFRAHIAGNAVQLLHRHVQLVALGVFQQQVVALGAAHVLADDIAEERHAVRRVHHVVARLEGEGDLGNVDARALARGHGSLRVGKRHQRHLRRREYHAQRDVHIHDVHLAALELGGGIAGHVQNLIDGNAQVNKGKLHFLTRPEMRHGKHHGKAGFSQRAQPAEQLVGVARNVDALHHQLAVYLGAHAHDGNVGGPRVLAEVQLGGPHVQVAHRDGGADAALGKLVVRVHGVVHQRARLYEHGERIGGKVVPHRCGALQQVRRHQVGQLAGIVFQTLQQLALVGVRFSPLRDCPRGMAKRGVVHTELAHREQVDRFQGGNGLPGRGKEAADLVQLIAEEIQAHRERQVAGEHVDGAALHAERARAVQFPRVLIAHGNQAALKVVEAGNAALGIFGKVCAHTKAQRLGDVRRRRGDAPQKGPRRGNHDNGLTGLQGPQRPQARAVQAGLGRRVQRERVARVVGEAQHALFAHEGGHRAGERLRGIFARAHHQGGSRVAHEARCNQERAGRGRNAYGGVFGGVQLPPSIGKRAGLGQLGREHIDEHGAPFP